MSGLKSRNKGVMGQRIAADLLRDRDWTVSQLTSGVSSEDLIATCPDGKCYSVEVKNTKSLTPEHIHQAKVQAERKKLRWMCMRKLFNTRSWLVERQGQLPQVWHEKIESNESD